MNIWVPEHLASIYSVTPRLRSVLRRLNDAGVSEQHIAEEIAAYAIEHYAAAPAGVRSTVESLVGTAKAWVYRHSGVQAGAITPAQLVSLTQAALRGQAG